MSITFFASGDFDDAAPSVNASNTNAFSILRHLGIDANCCGSIGAFALWTRIERALHRIERSGLDHGVPAVDLSAPGKARFIDCGVRPGYFAERLIALRRIAERARDLGVDVAWG